MHKYKKKKESHKTTLPARGCSVYPYEEGQRSKTVRSICFSFFFVFHFFTSVQIQARTHARVNPKNHNDTLAVIQLFNAASTLQR